MQATAYTYDPETRSGSVLLDDGTPVPFGTAAFDAGGLLLLRPGQRVRIEVAAGGEADGGTDTGRPDGETPSHAASGGRGARDGARADRALDGTPDADEPSTASAPSGTALRITLVTLATL
ncbi:hypothetical protein [Streptomyces sulfonofaciens]|nr:hypothetical protein [Streptomyces sulfonofaciens]